MTNPLPALTSELAFTSSQRSPLPAAPDTAGEARTFWFILNPAANRGAARKRIEQLATLLRGRGIETTLQLTTAPGDATLFAAAAKESAGIVVACGGDGTMHEVAESLIHTGVPMGCIPMGSGNDFAKSIATPKRLKDALDVLLHAPVKIIDAAQLRWTSAKGEALSHRFVNTLGIGFAGHVAAVANRATWLRGFLIYLYAVLAVIVRYKATPMRLVLHTETGIVTLDETVFMLTVGNGSTEGGAFRTTLHAKNDDGWLDVCLLRRIPRRSIFKWIVRFVIGTHLGTPEVFYTRVTKLEAQLLEPQTIHLDGEVLERVSGTLTIEVLPRALRVISPAP